MNRREREIQAYAAALYEAVVEQTLQALNSVARRLAEDGDLRALLEDPARDVAEKHAVLRHAVPAGAGEAVSNFLGVLVARQDIGYLDEVIEALQKQAQARREVPQVAEITSAVPLSDGEREELEAKLRERFGSNLTFRYHVDAEILGGLIVRVGDKLLDNSLRSRLESLRSRLEAVV